MTEDDAWALISKFDEEKIPVVNRTEKGTGRLETPIVLHDSVNHPDHYTQGKLECIDAIEAALGVDGFKDFCIGCAIKYLWRWKYKDGKKDIAKAQWYLARVIDMLNKEEKSDVS